MRSNYFAAWLLLISLLSFASTTDPFVQNKKLGRGINIGNISETMSTYGFQFTMTAEGDQEAVLIFNLGAAASTIYLDNLRLINVSETSSIRQLNNHSTNSTIFTVDAFHELQVSFYNQNPQRVTISVFCAKGRLQGTESFDAPAGENRIHLSTQYFPGPLLINMQEDGRTLLRRVVHVK